MKRDLGVLRSAKMVKGAVDESLVQELAKSGREPPARFVQKEENRPFGVFPQATAVLRSAKMVKGAVEENLVQELAKSGRDPPARFVQKEENRPIGVFPQATDVPVIHLRGLIESESGEEALRLNHALKTWGLFHIVSDDVPASFLDEVRSVSKKFFDLPKEEKLKYKNYTDDGEFKFEGYGTDLLITENQVHDWNDRLFLLVQPENERNLELWPNNPSSFRSVLHEFSIKLRKIADNVLIAIAKLLELEENYFTNQCGEDVYSFARFTYYPGCSRCDTVIGMRPHSDESIITLVLPDKDVEGLQVLKDGEWFAIPIVPNALLVFLGDQLEITCNGIFKSSVHRVIINSQERISVSMFYSANAEQYIEPASKLVDEARPKLYKKVLLKEYRKTAYEAFAHEKRTIDFVKI